MSEELYFPPIGPDVTNGFEYKAENGVTYTWNPGFSAWMIGSSQQVNKDYVDSRDQLRLRIDGRNHMYGDLYFKEDAEPTSKVTVSLTQSGVLTLGKNKNIDFLGGGGTISVSGQSFLKFSNTEVNAETNIYFAKHLEQFASYTGTKSKVTMIAFNTTSNITSSIAIAKGANSYFMIRKSGSHTSLFSVRSDGSVRCNSTQTPTPFAVLTDGTDHDNDAFKVDSQKGVYVSKILNQRLLNSENSATPVEDHSVATKGYIDRKSPRPGYGIVALKEEDADVNGFWRNGNNLYLRVS